MQLQCQDFTFLRFYLAGRSVEYINTLNNRGRGPHWKLDYSLKMSLSVYEQEQAS